MPRKEDKRYYLGNTKLPTPDATFDYTQHPEWVEDLEKCRKNILYFAENFFYIVNLDEGKMKIKLHTYQRRILRGLRDHRFVILLSSRQSGKSTLMTIYALWIACFFDDQRVLIVANKESTAINIFKRVRLAYEQLPNYLKPGTVEWGKTSLALGNGSSIGISTTSSDAGRGDSCNVLVLDELAFIDNNLVEDFWKSVYPIISSSKKSKIFVASTPNGTGNLFYDLYAGALKNENGWHAERVDWHEVPGRDEEWKEKTKKSLGSHEAFQQEFCNEFLATGESTLSEVLFEKHKANAVEPQFIFEDGNYFIWSSPNPEHIYAVGVDVSEGIGHDATSVQVLDITDLSNIEQVALYHNTKINPVQFIPKLHEILQHWGNPPVCIERNNCGAQVVDQLKNQFNYENIVSYGSRAGGTSFNRLGIFCHTNTKFRGISTMRYYVNELFAVKIRDIKTLIELKSFVRKENGTWAATDGTGIHDDRVMSLIWAILILDDELVSKYFEVLDYDENKRPLRLKSLDYGVRTFNDPTKTLFNTRSGDPQVLPILMNSNMQHDFDDDLAAMKQDGWTAV